MGEVGLSINTVLYDLTLCECKLIIKGYRKRERTQWLTTRWLIWSITSMLNGTEMTPEEMFTFPWENKKTKEEIDDEDERLKKLMEEAKRHNEGLNNK